jgi:hypothetical protein
MDAPSSNVLHLQFPELRLAADGDFIAITGAVLWPDRCPDNLDVRLVSEPGWSSQSSKGTEVRRFSRDGKVLHPPISTTPRQRAKMYSATTVRMFIAPSRLPNEVVAEWRKTCGTDP